ncbi:9215_t:CDS:1, partial [Cetraspora pellucida]
GPDKGNLISSFLQKKALNFINSSLYKSEQDLDSLIQINKTLQKKINKLENLNSKKSHKIRQLVGTLSQYKRKHNQHISSVCAAAHKPPIIDSRSLKSSIQSLIMKNKYEYKTQFINMTTQVSQIGQMSF